MNDDPVRSFWENQLNALGSDSSTPNLGRTPEGRTIRLTASQRDRGLYVVGRPGTGKTTLLQNLIVHDLKQGHGFALLTPEQGTITERILPFVPAGRWKDVVYVNPLDIARPVPLNPLHLHKGEPLGRSASDTMSILQRTFGQGTEVSAPRMTFILRFALRTLMQIPGSNLSDIELLLDDEAFRKWAVGQIVDRRATEFWQDRYPRMGKEAPQSLYSRLSQFLDAEYVAPMVCARGQSLDFFAAMESGKILLFNLPDSIGEDNRAILGQLIVARFQQAALRRREEDLSQPPFFIYLDEFQTFAHSGIASYEVMLSRARKRRVPLILAHQYADQLDESVMHAILGTVSTSVVYSVQYSDARRLGKELGVPTEELQHQAQWHCRCRDDSGVHQMKVAPPPVGGDFKCVDDIIKQSRASYGVPPSHESPPPGRLYVPPKDATVDLGDVDPGDPFA